ncbi:MAG: gas vesicle protein [Chlorobium sp.]|nr:MAG: gas vesicle protein [Chlorobium sp.]
MQNDFYDINKEITILDALDRVLTKGVVITGDIVISVADIDLIYVGLRVLLSSVETMKKNQRLIDIS